MSEKYKEAMDKIVVSDELKTKIISNITAKKKSSKSKAKHSVQFYARYGMGYAACFLVCLLSISLSKNLTNSDIIPIDINTPTYEVPAQDSSDKKETPTPKGTEKEDNISKKEEKKPADKTSDVNGAAKESRSEEGQKYNAAKEDNNMSVTENHSEITEKNIQAEKKQTSTENEKKPNFVAAESGQLTSEKKNMISDSTGTENTADTTANNADAVMSSGGGAPLSAETVNEDTVYLAGGISSDFTKISDIEKQLGYPVKIPQYMPDGYETEAMGLLFGETVQIMYTSADDTITYRTKKTDEDISGDYNTYEKVETEDINGEKVTLKGNENLCNNATWNDGMSHSLTSDRGIEKETAADIIESVDYSE